MLAVLVACGKEDDPDADLTSSTGIFKEIIAPVGQFPVQAVAVSPNKQFFAVKMSPVVGTTPKFYYSDDAGETWKQFGNTDNSFSRSAPKKVTDDGLVFLQIEHAYYVYDGASVTAVQHPEAGWLDSAFLDDKGNLYYFVNCNCSISSRNKLSLKTKGATSFVDIEIPANSSFMDVAPGGGIYFLNSQTGDLHKHNPDTGHWTVQTGLAKGQPNKKQLAATDGNFYFASSAGVNRVTATGTVTAMPFTGAMTNYQNPRELVVSASGRVFVLQVEPNGIYEFTGGQWQLVRAADFHNGITGGIGTLAVAGETMYYPGAAEGPLAYGLVQHELSSGQQRVFGHVVEGQTVSLTDAIETRTGKRLAILNGALYELAGEEQLLPISLGQTEALSSLYEANDGTLLAFGGDVHRSSDGGHTWRKSVIGFPGYARHIVQELADGTYMAVARYDYDYYLGGTGFSVPRFDAYVSTSSDGVAWSAATAIYKEGSQYIASIDKEGIIFGTRIDVNSNYQQSNQAVRSDDGGKSWVEIEGKTPDLVASDGSLFHVGSVAFTNGPADERFIYKWNGSEWLELPSEIEQAGREVYTVERAHFSSDKKIIFVSGNRVYRSQKTY